LAEATNKIIFRTKHIAIKYHFFREHHLSEEIQVKKVDTTYQLADIFTKGLVAHQFQTLLQGLWVGLLLETMEFLVRIQGSILLAWRPGE